MVRRAGRGFTLVLAAAFSIVEGASGQVRRDDPARRIDVEVAYASASWLWPIGGGWRIGPEFGLGILEQKTVAPDGDDFTAVVHVGATSATPVGASTSVEFGVRLGIGELRSESCSGCVPGGYVGTTAALFFGGRRFQGGTRLTLGRASGRGLGAWSPIVGRIQF